MKPNFSGWASKNNLKCGDGRIIRKDAFIVNDGQKVPLVWNHQHTSVGNVLGHAMLTNKDEGVWADCYLNDTAAGRDAKVVISHGDVISMSIYANNVQQIGNEVTHGVIREVSLVLAGSNPGAFIESVMVHGEPMDDEDGEGVFYTGDGIVVSHSDEESTKDESKNESTKDGDTVSDVLEGLTDKQKAAVAIIVGQAAQDGKKTTDNEPYEDETKKEGGNVMKHNMFDNKQQQQNQDFVLTHSVVEKIFKEARQNGSLREAVLNNIPENVIIHASIGGVIAHSIDTTGMTNAEGTQTYGFNDAGMLFPDYKNFNTTPEFISRDMGWVSGVISGVHRTPFSRIRSTFANITEDDARAKGYLKGKQKKEEFFTTLKRTTDPQTVYKLQKLDRDDVIDITDFDVVAWIRGEMRMILEEELARAILLGDGRPSDSEYKIKEDHIRPIASDVPLFNTKVPVSFTAADSGSDRAKKAIDSIIRSRKNYKGSGNPTLYTTEDWLTEMLLVEDGIGHKLYKSEAELATTLRVSAIKTVEPMETTTVKYGNKDLPLIGVIVNLNDYNVGADKGGEISMFDDFDINFNRYEYLIETRISGALTKPYSALTILADESNSSNGGGSSQQSYSTKQD